jgi:hypothetical protein
MPAACVRFASLSIAELTDWYLWLGGDEGDPSVKGASLGEQVMLAAFEVSPHARADILDLAQSRIVGVRPEAAAPYVSLLHSLVANYPASLAEHATRMKVCLPGALGFLSGKCASWLLRGFLNSFIHSFVTFYRPWGPHRP